MFACGKCNGKGMIREFGHVKMGRCFECDGRGKVSDRKKSTIANDSAEKIVQCFAKRGEQERFFLPEEWAAIVSWVHRKFAEGMDPVAIRGKVLESCDRRVAAYWENN